MSSRMVSSPEGSGTRLPRPVTSRAGLAGWSGAVSGMGVRVGGRQGGCIVRLHIVPRAGVGSSANLAALLPPAGEGLPDVRSRRLGSRPRGRFIRGAVRCHAADARKPSMKYSRAALLPSPWAAGLFALLLALPVFARAQDGPGPTPGTPPTVLVLGDSLSPAHRLPTDTGCVAFLEDRT